MKNKRSLKYFLVVILFLTTLLSYSQKEKEMAPEKVGEVIEIPTPPLSRPRLLVNQNTLGKIQTRFHSNKMKGVRDKIYKQAAACDSLIAIDGKLHSKVYRAIDASAFLYLITEDKQAGEKASRMILNALPSLNPENIKRWNDRHVHRVIYSAAMVYDWCFDLMSNSDRQLLYTHVIRLVKLTEYGFPLTEGRITYLVNKVGEEKLPFLLAFGISAYSEFPDIYQETAGHLYKGLVPARNGFYPAHRHHQGSAYGLGRYQWEALSTFLITQMGEERPYIDEQGKVLYHTIYNRRPDNIIIPEGDDFNPSFLKKSDGSGYFGLHGLMITANEYQDPYLQDEVNRYNIFLDQFTGINDAVLELLYTDETLESKSIEELPLTKFFNPPLASMTARTAWDIGKGTESNAVVVTMNMSNYYFGNHDHLDAGHFYIYYKGPLAIDAGAYAKNADGRGKHGGDAGHWGNYFRRTIAHNTLLIRDPDEPYRPGSIWDAQNEGGQVINSGGPVEQYNGGAPLTFEDLINDGEQVELLAHGFGPDSIAPDYSYIKGDMANAYSAKTYLHRPPKVKEAKRSFVFLNMKNDTIPGVLLVYDMVKSAKAEYAKRWLLHSMEEPDVTNNISVINRTTGRLNYSGKLVNQTILPERENLNIVVVGGKGKDFLTESANKNWALANASDIERYEAGQWRIEISPKKESETDCFFNVMQMMETGINPVEIQTIQSEKLIGAQINDRVVLFAKDGLRQKEKMEFAIYNSTGPLKVLITDLLQGSWLLEGNGHKEEVEISKEAGSIYIDLVPGSYTVKPL